MTFLTYLILILLPIIAATQNKYFGWLVLVGVFVIVWNEDR